MKSKKLHHKPYMKFKGWIRENGITYEDLANLLGLKVNTISFKINGQSDFLLSEIQMIQNTYSLDSSIFFDGSVA